MCMIERKDEAFRCLTERLGELKEPRIYLDGTCRLSNAMQCHNGQRTICTDPDDTMLYLPSIIYSPYINKLLP